jgi:hypothetical protein
MKPRAAVDATGRGEAAPVATVTYADTDDAETVERVVAVLARIIARVRAEKASR